MIFAKMYHDKSAPAGGFTHMLFTKDFDPSSLNFSPCVMGWWVCCVRVVFSSKGRLKVRKADPEELAGRTQSNTVQLNQETQGYRRLCSWTSFHIPSCCNSRGSFSDLLAKDTRCNTCRSQGTEERSQSLWGRIMLLPVQGYPTCCQDGWKYRQDSSTKWSHLQETSR